MEHVRDIELIELAADRVPADRKEALEGHLRQCVQCREKYDSLRQTWDILGAWEIPVSGRPESLRSTAEPEPRKGEPRRLFFGSVGRVAALRLAAAFVVAVPVSYLGGRWSVRSTSVPQKAEPPAYISALELDAGESLSWLVLQDDATPSEDGRT